MLITMFIFFIIILLLMICLHIKSVIKCKREILSAQNTRSRLSHLIDELIIETVASVVYILLTIYFIYEFVKYIL